MFLSLISTTNAVYKSVALSATFRVTKLAATPLRSIYRAYD